ncbi:FKBP-type peptidyl-prolyl cis-trans isomerase [Ferruginibacter yonginensis]|uniref:peptidylprolyl isomerase n=1 Tax=Ferruginibacter yonginensis TaxID=1310416 RepID=A0ABV8QNZ0_9BACT
MRKIAYLLFAVVTLTACNQSFKKGDEGIQYKIIADGKGETIKPGDYIEFHFTSILNNGKKDSILNTTREMGAPQIILFDSTSLPPAYFKIFKLLRKGDSLCTKVLTDSVFKKQPEGSMPPFMKKGQYLFTNIKITNVYKTKEAADSAQKLAATAMQEAAKAKSAAQLVKDDKVLNEYFAKNNIKAIKTPVGAYVEILQPGTGANLDTTSVAKINYTGKTLAGKMFDSNTDPSMKHVEPLTVNLTNDQSLGGGVIVGMADALKLLNKGAKAKLYIPSTLGYGPQGNGGDIGPNENLIFEVEILNVLDKAAAAADAAAAQKKFQEMQKRYMDSIQKANPQPAQTAPAGK